MASSSFSLLLLFSAAAFAMVAAIPPDANIDLPTNYRQLFEYDVRRIVQSDVDNIWHLATSRT
ncbi:hypothetical protein Cni_G05254 [Canna indica]|uniref:Uncharacterized protein n=1 Tax=Canna indica TaxID=4628 RepID=A0AAQ3Q588_9LILI|nr:hypothetical protein Cni_G05254 [Canna indica]